MKPGATSFIPTQLILHIFQHDNELSFKGTYATPFHFQPKGAPPFRKEIVLYVKAWM